MPNITTMSRIAIAARRCCRAGLIAMALVLFSGCSPTLRSDPPSYGDWRPAAGEAVDRIRFSNLIDWQPLDRDWILLRFNGGRSFAVRPLDPCLSDVRQARSLELVSALPNLLHRSDRVRLDENLCLIEEITRIESPPEERLRGSGFISGRR